MAILYTCSNTNLNTVKLVATAVRLLCERNKSTSILKVVIFSSSKEVEDDNLSEQVKVYKEVFEDSIRTEEVPLGSNGLGNVENFTEVFKTDACRYVDLTNGQKSLTSQLYLIASLLCIENIYYISLKCQPKELPASPIWGEHYEYEQLPPFTGISSISKLSYFDLVFYFQEIKDIFSDSENSDFLKKIDSDLQKSVLSFFQADNLRSAVTDATTSSEVLINELLIFLKQYQPAQDFSGKFKIDLHRQQDPLGAVTFFFKTYSREAGSNQEYIDENLEALLTVPGLLTPLRFFRNIAAHSGNSTHEFKSDEVRICINLALECFRCVKASKQFWERLSYR